MTETIVNRKRGRNLNFLTGREFRRLAAKMGGLWSPPMLADLFGDRGRAWVNRADFPDPAWIAGRTKLYSGWEVYFWMLDHVTLKEAEQVEAEIRSMARKGFDEGS